MKRSCKHDNLIALNNVHVSKVAVSCEAYFSAIVFAEMVVLGSHSEEDKQEVGVILKTSYRAIGQSDAIVAFLDPINDYSGYLFEKRMWRESFLVQDVALMSSPSSTDAAYARVLHESGLYNLAHIVGKSTEHINYDCLWRLGDWSCLEIANEAAENPLHLEENLSKHHYFALKNLRDRNEISVKVNIKSARSHIVQKFKLSNYECVKNIYQNLMHLNQLQQIEDFCDVRK